MASSSTEKCLIEETPRTSLRMNQEPNVKDKGNEENENEEPMEDNQETQSLRTKECLVESNETQNFKERPQVVKPGDDVPKWFSCRWILCYTSFFGMCLFIATRVSMSVAIVYMVKKRRPLNNTNVTIDPSCISNVQDLDEVDHGEFEWSELLVANILAGFYYGYALTNLLGGFLADRYGGKRIFGYSLLTSSLVLLAYPVLSRVSGYCTLVLRIVSGLLTGPFFPAMQSLWGRWAPPTERGRLMAVSTAGSLSGKMLTSVLVGYLCAYGFDNGWGSVFYLIGAAAFLYSLLWFYIVYDNPQKHPRITTKELDFLESSIQCQTRVKRIPWMSIMTSRAVWAILVAHFCSSWNAYTIETMLPLFMKEVLHFDIKANGLMSSIPYIGMITSYTYIGTLADFLIRRRYLTVRGTRIFMQCTAFIGSASFFVATGFIKCSNAMVAVWFLFFTGAFMGYSGAGFMVNHVDIAPSYAGLLFGMTNTVGAVAGFLAPTVAGALTPTGTQEEWQKVFFVCGSIAVFGATVFAVLVRGEVQEWASHSDVKATEMEEDDNTSTKA